MKKYSNISYQKILNLTKIMIFESIKSESHQLDNFSSSSPKFGLETGAVVDEGRGITTVRSAMRYIFLLTTIPPPTHIRSERPGQCLIDSVHPGYHRYICPPLTPLGVTHTHIHPSPPSPPSRTNLTVRPNPADHSYTPQIYPSGSQTTNIQHRILRVRISFYLSRNIE